MISHRRNKIYRTMKTKLSASLKLLFCLALVSISYIAQADVYTLWRGGKSAGYDLDSCLKPHKILDEPVLINGNTKAKLKIGMVRMDLNTILSILKKRFPQAIFATGGNSILVKVKLPNGWHKRLLLVYFGDFMPLLQISMTLPPKLSPASRWPDEMIKTSDAQVQRYLYFPNRKTWYGRFKTSMEPAQALSEVNHVLKAQGWSAITGEASGRRHGQGEIFLKKKPLSVMLVNFSQDGNAIVLSRSLK